MAIDSWQVEFNRGQGKYILLPFASLPAVVAFTLYVSMSTPRIHASSFPYPLSSVPCNLNNTLLSTYSLFFALLSFVIEWDC